MPSIADIWNGKFTAEHYVYGQSPNAHLQNQAVHLKPGGRVLVPGDGEGRNGVWLAAMGMNVLSVDASSVGLSKARKLAEQRGVGLSTEQADLLNWPWPRSAFDAVVSIFLHFEQADRPAVHAAMTAALKPGGLLILEAFRPEQLRFASGGPKSSALLYSAADLRRDFRGLDILMLDEIQTTLDEGPFHQGPAAVVRMVGVKRGVSSDGDPA
ncbi:MAG TPA: class I SAM-dependent methyltransferase [Candidatus Sulfotelmatobacter sp.]|jgi:SAM-dependent methyltransferase|nr:class I SAM-dependent methyltransferase [Candidatus Sulfotelmatobacter sp.]